MKIMEFTEGGSLSIGGDSVFHVFGVSRKWVTLGIESLTQRRIRYGRRPKEWIDLGEVMSTVKLKSDWWVHVGSDMGICVRFIRKGTATLGIAANPRLVIARI